MPLELNVLNSPPMDGQKYEIKNDGWWLMKITVVSQNQDLQNYKNSSKYNDRSRVAAKQPDKQTNKQPRSET